MALRRPPTTFSDEITAGDLAANSVTASELADNAVDSDAIAANAVVTAKIADSSSTTTGITPAKIAENAVTSAKIATGAVIADGIGAGAVVEAGLGTGAVTASKLGDVIEVKPHIRPGTLYPGYNDKQIDGITALAASTTGPGGSTITSSKYGTVQSDGRMYYYTHINGSKPIEDPRIGAHFGSQRHRISSIQLLDQETGIHGHDVFSIDGRKWMRCTGGGWSILNNSHGTRLAGSNVSSWSNQYIEVVGYFNGINVQQYTSTTHKIRYTLDDASEVGTCLLYTSPSPRD